MHAVDAHGIDSGGGGGKKKKKRKRNLLAISVDTLEHACPVLFYLRA